MLPALVDAHGRPTPLERELARGGEGAVFALSNTPTQIAKVYHKSPSFQTVEKLGIMVQLANSRLLELAAWPTTLLFYAKTNQAAGFLMPRLYDFHPIQRLYNPAQRLKFFPEAGWNFQIRAAANLAAAFDEIHKVGSVVGDVNQSNVQVSMQALVKLIDCDSFQILANGKAYLCEVGVVHYIPPELQGKALRGLTRTENHDRFGLAVLIYQLLFVGRHPYSGIYSEPGDLSVEQLITEFRFAQGPQAHTWAMAPPPHTPTFADIPPELATLFRRAFERGGESGTRPKPLEWQVALQNLEKSLVKCTIDPGHTYWRGAGGCVWCRLAANQGPEYYFGAVSGIGKFVVNATKLQEVLKRLNACGLVDFVYNRDQFKPTQVLKTEPLPNSLQALNDLVSLLRGRHNRAQVAVEKIENEWQQTVADYQQVHANFSQSIQKLLADCRDLARQYQIELQQLLASVTEEQDRVRYLQLFSIADADIPKIGAKRKQELTSYGIITAADVDYSKIIKISKFGDVLANNLLNWKNSILKQYRFDPATAIAPAEQNRIAAKYQSKQQWILVELEKQIGVLETLAPKCQAVIQDLTQKLQQSVDYYGSVESRLWETQQRVKEIEAAQRKEEEERQRREAEARRKAEEERQRQAAEAKRKAEENRLRREAEAQRKAEEERQRKLEEERQRKAEEERQRKAEEERQRKAEEERQRKAEEERQRKAEEERQRKAEEERQRKAEEERQRKLEEERQCKLEEERLRQEVEARRKAEEERQRKLEEERQRKAEEERQRKAEEKRLCQATEGKQQRQEAIAKHLLEEQQKRFAEKIILIGMTVIAAVLMIWIFVNWNESVYHVISNLSTSTQNQELEAQRLKAEAERQRQEQLQREAEERRRAEEAEAAKRKAEAERQRQEQLRREAEERQRAEEAKAAWIKVASFVIVTILFMGALVLKERQRKAEEERQRKLEEERQRKLEEERQRKLEEERQRKLEEERQRKLEEERQRKLEEERQRKLEEERQRKLEEERQRKLEEERQRKLEEERQRKLEEERQRKLEEERQRREAEARRKLKQPEHSVEIILIGIIIVVIVLMMWIFVDWNENGNHITTVPSAPTQNQELEAKQQAETTEGRKAEEEWQRQQQLQQEAAIAQQSQNITVTPQRKPQFQRKRKHSNRLKKIKLRINKLRPNI